MPKPTHSPVFSEGSRVRDRVTGKTYIVSDFNSGDGWTTVFLPVPDDDGCRAMMLPTADLEPAVNSQDTPAPAVENPHDAIVSTCVEWFQSSTGVVRRDAAFHLQAHLERWIVADQSRGAL